MSTRPQPPQESLQIKPWWLALGICAGVVVGMGMVNIGLWLPVGIVIGLLGGNLSLLRYGIYKLFRGK